MLCACMYVYNVCNLLMYFCSLSLRFLLNIFFPFVFFPFLLKPTYRTRDLGLDDSYDKGKKKEEKREK